MIVAEAPLAPTEKPSKDQVNLALSVAKSSTASVGKFTKNLSRENEIKKPKGKKRKVGSCDTINYYICALAILIFSSPSLLSLCAGEFIYIF